ncbi:DnaJ-domain-containing protein [Backusella circina FSU 941]|nr:DnaJ-domain-containing protein [Backusella circina FSU 941]
MDPYEFTQSVHDDVEHEVNDDELEQLERELAPSSADYYGILNISKKATDEEIKDAYKKLCRFFHPDKHTDEEKRKMAESRFQVIQKAYEVLIDPSKRVIYDQYGEEGLTASWDLGPRYKSTEELREEYEKKAKQKREQDLESLVRSKAEFQLTLDATQVLDPYEPVVFAGFGGVQPVKRNKGPFHLLAKAQVNQLFMRHSFDTQLGPQTFATIGGSMVSRSGMGGGNVLGTIRHTVSPKLSGELTATLLKPRMILFKSYYSISNDSFVNTTTQANSIYEPPVISVTLGRRIFQATTGYITYRTGQWSLFGWGGDVSRKMDRSSVALGLAGATKKGNNFSCELQTGITASHLAGEYGYKLPNQARLRISGTLSSGGGIMGSVGSEHKISQYIRVGMSLECGVPMGIVVKFRVTRLGQKVVLPIILASDFDLRLAFFGAFVPASVAIALEHFFLKPRRKRLIKEKIDQLREEHADYLATRKQEALDAQQLMADISERKRNQEEKKADGLVIVKAWYGQLDDLESESVIDVTAVIQTLVNDSRLTIPGGHSKVNFPFIVTA